MRAAVTVPILAALVAALHGCMDEPTGGLGQHCPASKACDGDLVCNDANFCMPLQHVCVPEEGMECTCWDGSTGATTCKADGSGLRDCLGCPPMPDAGCGPDCIIPQCSCEGLECGDDGCGYSCGDCMIGEECTYGRCQTMGCAGRTCGEDDGYGGRCVAPCPNGVECRPPEYSCAECAPSCASASCGMPDGCGGQCPGDCGHGLKCVGSKTDYRCEVCLPDCNRKGCGDPDGCGDTCPGSCSGTAVCIGDDITGYRCCTPTCGGHSCGATDNVCGIPCKGSCGHAGQACEGNAQDGYYCTSCVIDCVGKQCGEDNLCGGTCLGVCAAEAVCISVINVGYDCCTPDCAGKECGEGDGVCNTQCSGPCPVPGSPCLGAPGDYYCGSCVPDCAGKACGEPDSCGKTCDGTCAAGERCYDTSGTGSYHSCCTPDCAGKQCQYNDGCGKGCQGPCNGNFTCEPTGFGGYQCVACTPGCAGKACGEADGSNATCDGPCADQWDSCQGYPGTYACKACVPSCIDKTCGAADDCGGTCHGACANGAYCHADRQCAADLCDGSLCGAAVETETCPGPCTAQSTQCRADPASGAMSCATCGYTMGYGSPCASASDCDCSTMCAKLEYMPCADGPTCPHRGVCMWDCASTGRHCDDTAAECLCTETLEMNGRHVCLNAACMRTGTLYGTFAAPVYDDCTTAPVTPGIGKVFITVNGFSSSYFDRFHACRLVDGATGRDVVHVYGMTSMSASGPLEIIIPTTLLTKGRHDIAQDKITIVHYERYMPTPPAIARIWTDHVAFEGEIVISEASTGGGLPMEGVLGAFVAEYTATVCDENTGSPVKCSEMK